MKDPKAELAAIVDFHPWVEMGDVYTFAADGVAYDTDQKLAVVGFQHGPGEDGRMQTTLQLRGSPAGAYLYWVQRFIPQDATLPVIEQVTPSYDGSAFAHRVEGNDACVSLWYQEPAVSSTWIQFSSTRNGSLTGTASTSGVRTYYVTGKNSAGELGSARKVEVNKYIPSTNDLRCDAQITAATSDTVTVTVTATSGGTVTYNGITGTGTLLSGPAIGVPSASGTVWVFTKGAENTGGGQAKFTASATGFASDVDFATIEERGRVTIPLKMRLTPVSVGITSVTIRVAVADPYPGGTITITYSSLGTGTVSPASGTTIGGGSVTADLATTAYVDFTIPRLDGIGTGTVTFTATAGSRLADSDAVEVPGYASRAPTASIDPVSSTTADETVSDTGVAGLGASNSTVSMRRRKYTSVSTAGTWTSPASSMANETVTRSPKWITYLELEVTDADGRVTTSEPYPVAPATPGVDGTTGGLVPGQIIPGTIPTGVNAPGGTALGTVESGGLRAYTTILANYQLAPATVIEALPVSRGVKKGNAAHGASVVFGSPAFPSTPHVFFGPGGLSYKASWSATDHGPVVEAVGVSASGFTMRAVLRQAVGTLTGRSISFSGDTATKATAAEAWDDKYRFTFSVTVGAGVPDPFDVTAPRSPSSVTLYFYSNDGSGDVQRSSRVFSNDTAGGVTFSSQVEDVTVDAMGNGDTFRIVIAYTEGNGGSCTPGTVTWDEATAPLESNMGAATVPFTAVVGT